MVKKRNTNWLLIITVFLFLLSIGVVVYKLIESAKGNVCEYKGKTVSYGETVIDEETKSPCVCTKDGIMVCEENTGDDSLLSSSFRTDNLEFSYSFLNTLVSSKPDFTNVKTVDISEIDGKLKVVIEREAWCSNDFKAPSQVAYYEASPKEITFSTMSAFEESLHTENCLLSNTFVLSNFESPNEAEFTIYYKNEEGEKIDLEACIYNGTLFGADDVFSSTESGKICTCSERVVNCE